MKKRIATLLIAGTALFTVACDNSVSPSLTFVREADAQRFFVSAPEEPELSWTSHEVRDCAERTGNVRVFYTWGSACETAAEYGRHIEDCRNCKPSEY